MIRIMLTLTVLLASVAQANFREIKTGDDVLACFADRAKIVATPFFGRWTVPASFSRGKQFVAQWNDSAGGNASLVLETGKPPAMIYCDYARTKTALGLETTGLVCLPTMANGIAYARLTRNVALAKDTAAVDEQVPLLILKNNKLWCTNH